MFAIPDAKKASNTRQTFGMAIVEDWLKVLDYAASKQILDDHLVKYLKLALTKSAESEQHNHSEVFYAYFRTLESIRHRSKGEAGKSILSLGNALLPYLRPSGPTPLPVLIEDYGVSIPAASPGTHLPLPTTDGCISPNSIAATSRHIEELVSSTWLTPPSKSTLAMRSATSPIVYEIQKYQDRTSTLASKSITLRPLEIDTTRATSVQAKLLDAFALVRSIDAEQAGEIGCLTEYVVPMDGTDFVGGSDIYLFGATFLRLDEDWSTLCYADHLVHEASHQLLHAVQEITPLLLNRNQLGQPSPIRSDRRPLYGTFHATFVFLRLAQFMHKALSSGIAGEAEAELRLHRHLLGLLQGLKILDDHADFSDKGKQVLDGWKQVTQELVANVGPPNLQLSAKLTWDYEPADDSLPLALT